ncbi:MAG TPA: kinase [Bacteroidales bacterium]|jgi:sugar/nucleoside kinase (ribokinase family)|nr:kinase [Bacteroidales bacterium]
MSKKNILIISGASYDSIVYLDKFPEPLPQTIHESVFSEGPGSTGVGKASNLCHLGFNTSLQILVGDDYYGKQIRDFLSGKPVNQLVDIDPKGTERHVNLMNKNGERISIFITSASSTPPIDYTKYEKLIQDADIVILNIIDYARQFIPLLKKYNKEVWTDLHDYNEGNPYHEDFIDAADYVFLSSDNLSDYKSTMQDIMSRNKKLVVCTHGKKGASALTSELKWYDSPIIDSYKVIDTNGAGDAFFSGYLYAHCKNLPTQTCLTYGHILGGLCVNSHEIAPPQLSEDGVVNAYMKTVK